jgi:hypothetical protein
MKSLRIAVLSLVVLLWVVPVQGSTIPPDPSIKQGGFDPSSPTPIVLSDFTIVSPSGTSPATSPCEVMEGSLTFTSPSCLFQDVINPSGTGQNITKLVFDVGVSGVTCALVNNIDFAHCTAVPFDDGGTMVTFSGGKGIPYQGQFTLNFFGFPKDTDFGGTSTTSPIPEPNTLTLFLAGVGALLIGRRLRPRHLS